MLTIIIPGIIAGLIAFFCTKLKKWQTMKEFHRQRLGGTIGAAIGTALAGAFFSGTIMTALLPTKEVKHPAVKLVSMRSGDSLEGAFLLGSGGVSSNATYRFMIRNDDDSMSPGEVDANKSVRIYEDAALHGEGYWVTYTVDTYRSSRMQWWVTRDISITSKQEFHVPVGSVVRSFKVE